MQEHNQMLFQYFILDFQWIISDCNVVICFSLDWYLSWLGLVVHHYPLFRRVYPYLCDFWKLHIKLRMISNYHYCKVEFNQPSSWLYSVPNFLVFYQLETLYLCGNHVRKVCMKNCSSVCKEAGTPGWISSRKPPNWSTRAKHARSWSVALAVHYRTKVPVGQAVCSRLELATQPSREVKPP